MNINVIIANLAGATPKQAAAIIELLDEGATVPFISRYRKERTDNADEVVVGNVKNEYERITELQKRKTTILATIEEQGKLTDELRQKIENCFDNAKLEDIYLPYRPKRRTRAMIAKEKGAEPFALEVFLQNRNDIDTLAPKYINDALTSTEEVIAAANDIIAEWVSENEKVRERVRRFFGRTAKIKSTLVKGKEEEGAKYRDYFEFQGDLNRQPSHRIMALLRAESEGFIKIAIEVDKQEAQDIIDGVVITKNSPRRAKQIIQDAIDDSFKRLIKPSLDNELLSASKEKADKDAIDVFAQNLRQLLLSSPLGSKNILAIDPGYRTGCKVVCLNRSGDLLHNETIYPHEPKNETSLSMKKISSMVESYKIEAIAIGDGTASRESEQLIKRIHFPSKVEVYMVSEDGASVYSASAAAREEFPEYDVTVRGAISIGRRLMDPLSELVKIDPKSIGVGQYQHDVEQNMLKRSLDGVVESCVNSVGVNLNTASYHLLSYVSGIGASLSKKIVEYRAVNGDFCERKELLKVPRLGAKVYEQCAGFLRIKDGRNPLDASAVHPESYLIVDKMAKDLGCSVKELMASSELRKKIVAANYITNKVGMPTITDILSELEKPGLDPREQIEQFEFAEGIYKIEDLSVGMVLPGIVTNITNFGAFVDVGVKQDGLVHISQLANRYVSNPTDIVKLHQKVTVKVIELDLVRKRVQLTMKGL
ncbi:MAG: Tex family protein [Rikenellaceae bacterium]